MMMMKQMADPYSSPSIMKSLQTSIWKRLDMTCSLQGKEVKCEVSGEYTGE